MPVLTSIHEFNEPGAPGAKQTLWDAQVNAQAQVVIPASPGTVHIKQIVAAYISAGAVSQVLTIVQGALTVNYTITNVASGGALQPSKLLQGNYPSGGGAITITLPAAGVGGVIGLLIVDYEVL